MKKTPALSREGALEELITQWKALLADRGVKPESEDAIRALPTAMACDRLTLAIQRLAGRSA